MSPEPAAWVVLAVWPVVLAVRMCLSEAAWPARRDEVVPRRVLRALDGALVVLTVMLATALAAVVVPPLLA